MKDKKEIKLSCNQCHRTYNPDLNSMICPHSGFPRIIKCKAHGRKDCGNLECVNEEPDINYSSKIRRVA